MKTGRLVSLLFVLSLALPMVFAFGSGTAEARCRHCGPGWGGWDASWGSGSHGRGRDSNLRRYGSVDTDIEPDEAEVLLDGKPIGQADDFDGFPGFLFLEPGDYRLEFRIPGYASFGTDLHVRAGRHYRFDNELRRLETTRKFEGGWGDNPPPHATTRVFASGDSDDDVDADDGDSDDEDRTAPPTHPKARPDEPGMIGSDDDESDESVEERPVRRPNRVRPSVEPRETNDSSETSPATAATIRLRITPDDASVWLDGKPLGRAREMDAAIPTTGGTHELVVIRTGFESRIVPIDVDPDAPNDVVVELEPIEHSE